MAKLTPDKTDFKAKIVTRDKEGLYIGNRRLYIGKRANPSRRQNNYKHKHT